jgi:hypothetical protein
MEILAGVIGAVLTAGVVLILVQTLTRGRWGFGMLRGPCPRCGAPLPLIRKPASGEEALWGGWTCEKCGCKVDKYGRERPAA